MDRFKQNLNLTTHFEIKTICELNSKSQVLKYSILIMKKLVKVRARKSRFREANEKELE